MKRGLVLSGGTARTNLELACRAEHAGFDSVFAVEFFNKSAYAVLGAIAAATERVTIGSGIANAFTRSPVLHASCAMDLDELSGGRMVLGLGSGTRRMNEQWYGVPFSRPASRMSEVVGVVRALMAAREGLGFDFEGEFFDLHIPAYQRPAAVRASMPIWLAGVNRPMVRTAGRVADGLVGHPIATRRWHREVSLPTLRAAEEQAGRPEAACPLYPYLLCVLDEDRERAMREAKQQIGFYFTVKLYRGILELHGLSEVAERCRAALRGMDLGAMAAAIPDALVDEIGIVCPPSEALQRLEQWRGLTDHPLLYAPTVGLERERILENIGRILEVFAPR